MSEAPDLREQEDCPSPKACDQSCDQHEKDRIMRRIAETRAALNALPWWRFVARQEAGAMHRRALANGALHVLHEQTFPPGKPSSDG